MLCYNASMSKKLFLPALLVSLFSFAALTIFINQDFAEAATAPVINYITPATTTVRGSSQHSLSMSSSATITQTIILFDRNQPYFLTEEGGVFKYQAGNRNSSIASATEVMRFNASTTGATKFVANGFDAWMVVGGKLYHAGTNSSTTDAVFSQFNSYNVIDIISLSDGFCADTRGTGGVVCWGNNTGLLQNNSNYLRSIKTGSLVGNSLNGSICVVNDYNRAEVDCWANFDYYSVTVGAPILAMDMASTGKMFAKTGPGSDDYFIQFSGGTLSAIATSVMSSVILYSDGDLFYTNIGGEQFAIQTGPQTFTIRNATSSIGTGSYALKSVSACMTSDNTPCYVWAYPGYFGMNAVNGSTTHNLNNLAVGPGAGSYNVYVDGQWVNSYASSSSGFLSFSAPAHSPGYVGVRVSNNFGTSNTVQLQYLSSIFLQSVTAIDGLGSVNITPVLAADSSALSSFYVYYSLNQTQLQDCYYDNSGGLACSGSGGVGTVSAGSGTTNVTINNLPDYSNLPDSGMLYYFVVVNGVDSTEATSSIGSVDLGTVVPLSVSASLSRPYNDNRFEISAHTAGFGAYDADISLFLIPTSSYNSCLSQATSSYFLSSCGSFYVSDVTLSDGHLYYSGNVDTPHYYIVRATSSGLIAAATGTITVKPVVLSTSTVVASSQVKVSFVTNIPINGTVYLQDINICGYLPGTLDYTNSPNCFEQNFSSRIQTNLLFSGLTAETTYQVSMRGGNGFATTSTTTLDYARTTSDLSFVDIASSTSGAQGELLNLDVTMSNSATVTLYISDDIGLKNCYNLFTDDIFAEFYRPLDTCALSARRYISKMGEQVGFTFNSEDLSLAKLDSFVKTALAAGDTNYYYVLKAEDNTGAVVYTNGLLATEGGDVFLEMSTPNIVDVATSSVTIAWLTNKPVIATLTVSENCGVPSYVVNISALSDDFEVTVIGLQSNTNYCYKVEVKDELGDTASFEPSAPAFTTRMNPPMIKYNGADVTGGLISVTATSSVLTSIVLEIFNADRVYSSFSGSGNASITPIGGNRYDLSFLTNNIGAIEFINVYASNTALTTQTAVEVTVVQGCMMPSFSGTLSNQVEAGSSVSGYFNVSNVTSMTAPTIVSVAGGGDIEIDWSLGVNSVGYWFAAGANTFAGNVTIPFTLFGNCGDTVDGNFTLTVLDTSCNATVTVTTTQMPAAKVGEKYSFEWVADQASFAKFSWDSNIPTGLWVSSSSWSVTAINGTPTVAGSYPFTFEASNYCSSTTVNGVFDILPCNYATITTMSIPNATSGEYFSATLNATNASYVNLVWDSGVPAGLSVSTSSGATTISGTPNVAGTYPFTFYASNNCSSVSKSYVLNVACKGPTVSASSSVSLSATAGQMFNQIVTAYNSDHVSAWWVTDPDGVSLSTSSNAVTISGIPTTPGTYTLYFTAYNDCSSEFEVYDFVVGCNDVTIPHTNVSWYANASQTFSETLTANNSTGINFQWDYGYSPSGVSVVTDSTSAVVSGIPSSEGYYQFTFEAYNSCSSAVITGNLTISSTSLSCSLDSLSYLTASSTNVSTSSVVINTAVGGVAATNTVDRLLRLGTSSGYYNLSPGQDNGVTIADVMNNPMALFNLQPSTTYYYQVWLGDNCGQSRTSVEYSFRTSDPDVPLPMCDNNNLNLCNDAMTCGGAGGYWYNNKCNTSPNNNGGGSGGSSDSGSLSGGRATACTTTKCQLVNQIRNVIEMLQGFCIDVPQTILNLVGLNSVLPESCYKQTQTDIVSVVDYLQMCPELEYDQSHPCVRMIQEYLNANNAVLAQAGGGSVRNETAYFCHRTENAMWRFQRDHDIPTTGRFDAATKAAIAQIGNFYQTSWSMREVNLSSPIVPANCPPNEWRVDLQTGEVSQ